MPLTDRTIQTLKTPDKDRFLSDGSGLYLRAQTSGTKTFMFRSRAGGVARWLAIGAYPQVTLAQARRHAAELAERAASGVVTAQDAYDAWIVSVRKTYKSPLQVEQRMGKHVLPRLAKQNLNSVTRADLSKLLTKIADTAPVQANRVLTDIKLLFAYSVERGWIENSPAHLITQKTVGGREATRSRFLSEEELVQLIGILKTDRFEPPTRWALLMLLLTGQRSGEVRGMAKSEVKGRTWELPPQRTKSGWRTNKSQSVYFNPATKFIADCMFKELGSAPFGDMAGQALARACKRMKFDPPFTPHDLRRTMATHMAELGIAPHIVEKCLDHTLGGVMAIYNRAEYAAEKRAAWRTWTRYLLGLRKKAPQ